MPKSARTWTLGLINVVLFLSGAVHAAEKKPLPAATLSLGRVFNAPEKWQASAYEETGSAAKLCFSGPKDGYCFEARTGSGEAVSNYNSVEGLSPVPLFSDKEPGYGVLFVAGGGHELPVDESLVEPQLPSRELGPAIAVTLDEGLELRLASLWTYRMDERKFVNIAPPLTFGSSGEVVLLSTLRPDLQGLLATADCKDETGFSGRSSYPHTCDIRLFRYSDKTLKFEPAGGYLAKTEYDSAPIIRREMKNIEAYLSGSLPAPVPQGIDESGYVLVKTLPLRKTFNTPETLQASAYEFEAEGKGNHDVGPLAKLCFEGLDLKDGRCFEAKTGGGHGYNVVQELSLVPLFTDKRPRYGILFIAYGIEYNRDRGKIVTLWAYRGKEHGFVNILPSLTFMTDLGAFSLLSTIRPDMEGVVAMASYVSGREEAHYDSHRYKISLYRYNDKAGIFKPIGGFVTKKKYDDTTLESIFYKEMKGIEKLLSRGK